MKEYNKFRRKINQIENSSAKIFSEALEELGPLISKLYNILKRRGCVTREKARYAPGDQIGWTGTIKGGLKCLYLSNCNVIDYHYIIIFNENSKANIDFSCFRYYKNFEGEDKTKPYTYYLDNVEILSSYSDNIQGNNGVTRPNLEFIIENYNDIINESKYFYFEELFSFKKSSLVVPEDEIELSKILYFENKNRNMVWKFSDIVEVGSITTLLMYDLTRKDI